MMSVMNNSTELDDTAPELLLDQHVKFIQTLDTVIRLLSFSPSLAPRLHLCIPDSSPRTKLILVHPM